MPASGARASLAPGRENLIDAACVGLAVLLLAAPFFGHLGFYSDDWALLADFQKDLASGQFGIHSMLRGYEARPLQGIQLALQYYLFGLDPLPHHLVNTAVLAAANAALYLLLARMGMQRRLALAAAMIFTVLPQLSTARVWYSTFQIPTALLLAMISLHAQLSFTRTGRRWWLAVAAVTALASMAAYEIFAPFILAFPAWLLIDRRTQAAAAPDRPRALALCIAAGATVALALVAKYLLTSRAQAPDLAMYMEGLRRLVKPGYDWRTEGSLNIFATIDVNLWRPIEGIGRAAAAVASGQVGGAAIAAAVAVTALTLLRIAGGSNDTLPGRGPLWTITAGIAAFLLGHATFLINSQIMFAPTGIGNRALVAMAVGVAILFSGLVGLAARSLPPRGQRFALAGAASVLILGLALRTEQIYSYWVETWAIEQRIFALARVDLRDIPANSTIMFDGVCPYHGPGIVLETWEAAGMLTLTLGRPIHGDTSADRMKIGRDGLITEIYDERLLYPYGPGLYVYDPGRRLLVPLPDRATALRYFASAGRRRQCPAGYVGQGQLI